MFLTASAAKWLIIVCILVQLTKQQPLLSATPDTYTAYILETNQLNLDPSANSFNGESCIESVTIDSITPTSPSWITNNGLNLTISPTSLSDRDTYTVKLLITETGTGVCTMVPHLREIAISVTKRGPYLNYDIPDYPSLRAGIFYEITFPEPICKDPMDGTLLYSGLQENGSSLPTYINLDLNNGRIYGTVPETEAGSISVIIFCFDEFAQSQSQNFRMTFLPNNNPVQHVTDFTPYTVQVAEGIDSVYIFPQGLYTDPDNDKIYFQLCYFSNYSNVDTSFAKFNLGYEGEANLTFTNPPSSFSINAYFVVFISDTIGSTQPPFQLPVKMNLRPKLLAPTVSVPMYPNDTFTWNFDVTTLFQDTDSGDVLSYSTTGLPPSLTLAQVSGDNYKISGDSSAISSDFTFNLIADDGVSLATPLPVTVTIASCHSNCTKCFGGGINECYSCISDNNLHGSSCVNPCPSDTFALNGVCETCHSYCKECNGPGNANCQVCESGYFKFGKTCDSTCPSGYFGDPDPLNPECIPCASGCDKCTGELAEECTLCLSNHVWNPTDSKCIEIQCLDDEYVNLGACHKCDSSCNGCVAATNMNCKACAQGYLDQGGECKLCSEIAGKMLDSVGNCIDVPATPSPTDVDEPLTCTLASVTISKITIGCSKKVIFLEKDPEKLFKIEITGDRKVYRHDKKLLTDLNGITKTIIFDFLPESTYIGMNNEIMKLTFLQKEKIISEANRTKSLSNSETEHAITFRSDAIPESVDTIAKTLGMIVGLGIVASFLFKILAKNLLGFYSTIGGYIDFIQIVSFIPLLDLYFPGNVRSYASILKLANVVASSEYNPFFLFINKDNLNDEPFNYRFDSMGINSRVFINNLGFQVTLISIFSVIALILKYFRHRCIKDDRRNRKGSGGVCRYVTKKILESFDFNTIIRTIVILSMYSFLSAIITFDKKKFKNVDQVLSSTIAMIALLFLIFLVGGMGYWITKNWGKQGFEEQYSKLFSHLKKTTSLAKFYIPIAMLRKGIFVIMIVTYSYDYRYLCFPLVIFGQFCYFVFILILRPYDNIMINSTLIMNESMILVILLFSSSFIERKMNNETALKLGWLWVGLCTITIVANWVLGVANYFYQKSVDKKNKSKAKIKEDKVQDVENNVPAKDKVPETSNRIRDEVRVIDYNEQDGSKNRDESINIVGNNPFGFDLERERNITISGNNVVNVNYNRGVINNFSQGKNCDTSQNMLRSEKSERHNSSDGSDQFGYEDRTTLFGSNKNLIRKLSDPLQVKVKRSVKDDSPSSMKSMLYEPRENFRKNTIHEESKELPRNTTGRFNSEEKNMSIDSSKSIPGLGSSIYYDGEEVSKKLTKSDKKT